MKVLTRTRSDATWAFLEENTANEANYDGNCARAITYRILCYTHFTRIIISMESQSLTRWNIKPHILHSPIIMWLVDQGMSYV